MSASRLILPLQKALRVSNSIYTVSWVLIGERELVVQLARFFISGVDVCRNVLRNSK